MKSHTKKIPVMLSLEDVSFIVAGLRDVCTHLRRDRKLPDEEAFSLIDENRAVIKLLEKAYKHK